MLSTPVLLYDGNCGFCRTWVERLRHWDRRGAVRLVPATERHDIPGLPVIPDADLDRAVHLVAPDGRIHVGADAAAHTLAYLPWGRPLALALRLPGIRWLSHRVYSAIARRRHRLGCNTPGCRFGERR